MIETTLKDMGTHIELNEYNSSAKEAQPIYPRNTTLDVIVNTDAETLETYLPTLRSSDDDVKAPLTAVVSTKKTLSDIEREFLTT